MIRLNNLVLRRGSKVILDGASAVINPAEKVGLVGRNGAGKSSLFALLTGDLHEDGGEFDIPKQWRMAQVAQEMPETDQPATDFVVDGDTVLASATQEVAESEAANDHDRMAHAYIALQDAGINDAVARAQALLMGLGFTTNQLDLPVNSFSGGWRMRLQLARALMCPSDLLLLDEPTNHLDLDALVWLESWLQRYTGTMLVISHDREFLDAITDVTLHIEGQKLNRYGGNYSKFEDMRALKMEQQQTAFGKQQEQIAHLQKFIDRFKAKASKAKQAQSRVKALERMEKVAPLLAESDFQFSFSEPKQLPNPMLVLQDADVGYTSADDAGAAHTTVIVKQVNQSVLAGQRVGILGANGQGKSTLIKTIAHDLKLVNGSITEGKGLSIGYFAQQELDVLVPADNPLEHMIRLAKKTAADGNLAGQATREQDLRSYLGSFNFTGDMVKQSVGSMSGGEKARLVLAMIVWQRPNLLLLDEPTNHLDLATREALAMALNGFEGTVLLVSHDRALLRSVCDEFWLVTQGGVKPFTGDLDDYQRYLLDFAKQQRLALKQNAQSTTPKANATASTVATAGASTSAAPAEPTATPAKALPDGFKPKQDKKAAAAARQALANAAKPWLAQQKQAEAQLEQLKAEQAKLHDAMQTAPTASTQAGSDIASLGKRLKAIDTEMAHFEALWLESVEQLEQLEALA